MSVLRTPRPPSSCSRSAAHTPLTELSWWEESQNVWLNASKSSWSWCLRYVCIAETCPRQLGQNLCICSYVWFQQMFVTLSISRRPSKAAPSRTTPTSTMRRTTTAASPCSSRRGGGGPWAGSPSACGVGLSACPRRGAADLHLPPDEITTTWVPAEAPHRHSAEGYGAVAGHATCPFLHRRHQEGEDASLCGDHFLFFLIFVKTWPPHLQVRVEDLPLPSLVHLFVPVCRGDRFSHGSYHSSLDDRPRWEVSLDFLFKSKQCKLAEFHAFESRHRSRVQESSRKTVLTPTFPRSDRRSRGDRYDSMVSAVRVTSSAQSCRETGFQIQIFAFPFFFWR